MSAARVAAADSSLTVGRPEAHRLRIEVAPDQHVRVLQTRGEHADAHLAPAGHGQGSVHHLQPTRTTKAPYLNNPVAQLAHRHWPSPCNHAHWREGPSLAHGIIQFTAASSFPLDPSIISAVCSIRRSERRREDPSEPAWTVYGNSHSGRSSMEVKPAPGPICKLLRHPRSPATCALSWQPPANAVQLISSGSLS